VRTDDPISNLGKDPWTMLFATLPRTMIAIFMTNESTIP